MQEKDPLRIAVQMSGGQVALAAKLTAVTGHHYRQQHVWSWLNRTKRVPPEAAIPIERITDGQVTRHQLRPDLYPLEDA